MFLSWVGRNVFKNEIMVLLVEDLSMSGLAEQLGQITCGEEDIHNKSFSFMEPIDFCMRGFEWILVLQKYLTKLFFFLPMPLK